MSQEYGNVPQKGDLVIVEGRDEIGEVTSARDGFVNVSFRPGHPGRPNRISPGRFSAYAFEEVQARDLVERLYHTLSVIFGTEDRNEVQERADALQAEGKRTWYVSA